MSETDPDLDAFLLEFRIAKSHIAFVALSERLRKHTEGAILQRSRWEAMGHHFVFPGLDAMIQTGKDSNNGQESAY